MPKGKRPSAVRGRRMGNWGKSPDSYPRKAMWVYSALDFAGAADACIATHGEGELKNVVVFLLAHAFELAAKSILLAKGVPYGQVRNLDHDLTAAVSAARKLGVEILDPTDRHAAGGIEMLTNAYASKELQYREFGRWHVPAFQVLRRQVDFTIRQAIELALTPAARERLMNRNQKRIGLLN